MMHHTQFLKTLLDEGRLTIEGGKYKGKRITFHDPCYLGRANNVYEAPRELISKLEVELVETKRSKANGLCCGAGGAQMFKDAEPGNKEINIDRAASFGLALRKPGRFFAGGSARVAYHGFGDRSHRRRR